MGYVVTGRGRNRRVCKQIVHLWGRISLWDIGPYERPDQFHRAVGLMSTLERAERTDHWIYPLARQVALASMTDSIRRSVDEYHKRMREL